MILYYTYIYPYRCVDVWMYGCMHGCMCVADRLYACMYVCMRLVYIYSGGPAVRIWENQTSVFNASPGYICFHMLLSCVNSHIEFKK